MYFTPFKIIVSISFLMSALTLHAQSTQVESTSLVNNQQSRYVMTEEHLKNQLDARLEEVKKRLEFDKYQANQYAEAFARRQKQQANALKNMMDQSNLQREYILQRIQAQHDIMLKQFQKYQIQADTQ